MKMSSKKKNIVFVVNDYDESGGTQRVVSTLAKEFIADGHHVELFSINERKIKENYFKFSIPVFVLHKNGYRLTKLKSLKETLRKRKWKNLWNELRKREQLNRHVNKTTKFFNKFGNEEVFVIIIQVWGMQWLEPLLYKKNIHIIGTSHESYYASKPTHRYQKIKTYYRMADKFVLLTEKDAELFEKEGFSNTMSILNPSSFRKENKPNVRNQYNKKGFCMMGRMVKEKGFQDGIEAFREFIKENPEWKMNIYGDGKYRNKLEELVENYHLEEKVLFHGETDDPMKAFEENSVFLLPSYAEGLPMTIIEAQSMGLPCIATDCAPGIRVLIDDYKNGYVTTVKSPERLSVMMSKIINFETYENFSLETYNKSEAYLPKNIKEKWYTLFESIGGK